MFYEKNEVIDESSLVDIKTVKVDKSLPKYERIAEYIRQIKNPYVFKCGDFIVRAKFTENGPTIEDCIKGILR